MFEQMTFMKAISTMELNYNDWMRDINQTYHSQYYITFNQSEYRE